ncbi:MAG: hypothetical protein Q7S88_01790 [Candidatus Daviesbacteria bacterium]|nr:hypothetical protein [Candidatus Daviesbacteria bacterium]
MVEAKRKLITGRLNLGEIAVPFRDIHQLFADSPYGRKLEGEIRYGAFKPREVTNSQWVEILGPDVNNLYHLPLSYLSAGVFTKDCGEASFPSLEDREDMLLTGLTHDWGEAISGDLQYGTKTARDEEEELEALLRIAQEVTTDALGGDRLVDRINKVSRGISFNPKSVLGTAFNVLERCGYTRTALRAWKKTYEVDKSSDVYPKLHLLAHDVGGGHLAELVNLTDQYPAVAAFLTRNNRTITEMFNLMPRQLVFEATGGQNSKTARFDETRESWFENRHRFSRLPKLQNGELPKASSRNGGVDMFQ